MCARIDIYFLYYFVSSVILSKFVITGLFQNKIFFMLKSQQYWNWIMVNYSNTHEILESNMCVWWWKFSIQWNDENKINEEEKKLQIQIG